MITFNFYNPWDVLSFLLFLFVYSYCMIHTIADQVITRINRQKKMEQQIREAEIQWQARKGEFREDPPSDSN